MSDLPENEQDVPLYVYAVRARSGSCVGEWEIPARNIAHCMLQLTDTEAWADLAAFGDGHIESLSMNRTLE